MKKSYLNHAWLLLLLLLTTLTGQAQVYNGSVFTRVTNLDPNRIYKIVNTETGQAIEVGGSDRYAQHHAVNAWTYWGGAHQQWRFEHLGNGVYRIVNRNSNQLLSYSSGNDLVQDFNWNSTNQQWIIETNSFGGRYRIRLYTTGTDSRRLEHTDWDQVKAITPYESEPSYQAWRIVDESANQGAVFQIINVNSGKALSANADDNRVTQWTNWGLAGQQWSFSSYNSDNYLSIINRNTQQVLEIGGGGDLTQPGRTANLWDGWGGEHQQWALLDINDSHVLTVAEATDGRRCKIYNRLSGKVLEIGGNGSELYQEDRAANQWYDWSGPNQQWYISYVSANRGAGTTLGTEKAVKAASRELTVYPNPARTVLTVGLTGVENLATVKVTDVRGSATSARYLGQGKVDVSDLTPGIYVVSVTDAQRTYHQKFVKE